MPTSTEEARLVIRAQCGDRQALEVLLRGVQPALQRYVTGLVGSTDADDVSQDVLVTVARKLPWLSEPQLFRAWMYRIASRAAFKHLRRIRSRDARETDDAVLDSLAAPEPPPGDEILRELLDSDLLSPASRAVLVLHFQEEMSLPEVAAVLEIPLGTVKSRLGYGLKVLRRHLAGKRSQ